MLVLGISGKKQSGKSSLANYLQAWWWVQSWQSKYLLDEGPDFRQKDDGEIEWLKDPPEAVNANLGCRIVHFADALKDKICIDILGLSYEQCYGTNQQKNSLTRYRWENFPDEIRIAYSKSYEEYSTETEAEDVPFHKFKILRKGFMTARAVMQVSGTDIFRKMFSKDIWVNATFDTIRRMNSVTLAIIPDVRFPSEVEAVIKEDGYVINLARYIIDDRHASEISLDGYRWEQHGEQCLRIDNSSLSMQEKNNLAREFLVNIIRKKGVPECQTVHTR